VFSNSYLYGFGGVYTPAYLWLGNNSIVSASNCAAMGDAATASSYSSLVVGRFNKLEANDNSTPSTSAWFGKDPLFILGNGASTGSRNNAFAVYKDGTVTMSNAQGDISMGQFGN
jgi:hypothetical protein